MSVNIGVDLGGAAGRSRELSAAAPVLGVRTSS